MENNGLADEGIPNELLYEQLVPGMKTPGE
jgi:hypothetical protein